MTAREIIESAGGEYIGEWYGLMYFKVAEMPGATMIMDVRAINSVADVEKYIEWMRAKFAPGKHMENQW